MLINAVSIIFTFSEENVIDKTERINGEPILVFAMCKVNCYLQQYSSIDSHLDLPLRLFSSRRNFAYKHKSLTINMLVLQFHG